MPRRSSPPVQRHDLRAAIPQILDELQRVRLRVHEPYLHTHHNMWGVSRRIARTMDFTSSRSSCFMR